MSLSTKIKTAVMAVTLAVVGVGAVLAPTTATYANSWKDGVTAAKPDEAPENLNDNVKSIINLVLYVVGILAVVMIIIGGVQYTTSGGDSAAVTKAKNTILYGIVGLVIAILAYAIVNFVLEKVIGNG